MTRTHEGCSRHGAHGFDFAVMSRASYAMLVERLSTAMLTVSDKKARRKMVEDAIAPYIGCGGMAEQHTTL